MNQTTPVDETKMSLLLDFIQYDRELMSQGLFFGCVFDLLLFGILTTQIYIYYISFPNDRSLLKSAVIWIYLVGAAQTGLAFIDLYNMAAQNFVRLIQTNTGASELRLNPDHLWLSITTLTAVVAIVIQSLYAHRIFLLSEKRWLAAMILCMSIGQFGSGILGAICYHGTAAVSNVFQHPEEGSMVGTRTCINGFTWIWGPVNIACDLTITICMVTFLIRHRKRTIRRQTRSNITKIIQIVIQTGMASTILMILYTVLFWHWAGVLVHWSDSLPPPWHPFPGLMMSKVYSNSMLALLNNRATIVNGRNAVGSFELVEVLARGPEGDIQLRTRGRNYSTEV